MQCRHLFACVMALFLSATFPAVASAQTFSRSEVTDIIREFGKVVTPNGVEENLLVPIGGTNQWVSVRGRDRRNPILLVIHGGPASPEMPMSWAYQSPWEDYFTVVQWDQRGSGKSYLANDPEGIGPSLSLNRIIEDAHELVGFLQQRYSKSKVFVLGHSWGSEVGLSLAYQHPELLYAYIGMGQIVSGQENERIGYALTLAAAKAADNETAVRELEAIAPYPNSDGSVTLNKIDVDRKWSNFFGGLTAGRSDFQYAANTWQLSPDYTDADVNAISLGSKLSLVRLLPDMTNFDFSRITDFGTPIIIFAGRHDTTTPPKPVVDWFGKVRAPVKKLIWFENSSHEMLVEEPGRTLVHLVDDVLPLATDEKTIAPK